MTLKTLMTTTALSVLMATSVVAQTDSGTTAPADGTAPMATDNAMDAETMAPQSLSEMTVGDLTGTDVMDGAGESIGSITDVFDGQNEGEAVIGIGGFLGIGQYDVALPLSDLDYNPEDQVISVSRTREELEAMPEFDPTDREPLPGETQLSTLMSDESDDAPAMDAPATDAPATDAPATDAPATDAPATDAPATDAPATDAPATDAPATDAPATDAPATDAPATDAPETDAPETDAPAEGETESDDASDSDTMESDSETEEESDSETEEERTTTD